MLISNDLRTRVANSNNSANNKGLRKSRIQECVSGSLKTTPQPVDPSIRTSEGIHVVIMAINGTLAIPRE